MHRFRKAALAVTGGLLVLITGCTSAEPPDPSGSEAPAPVPTGRPDCTHVFAAVSSEKVNLFTALGTAFQDSEQAKALAKCVDILPQDVASGEGARLLSLGWPEDQTATTKPAIWSPASTNWTDQVRASQGASLLTDPVSFARSPLVFAMPEQMARMLGWPDKPVGYQTLHDLCLDPNGWGSYGGSAALWGAFKLAKTNPTTSTSGLNTVLGQSYAATGKQADLTEADIAASEQFSREFESCVIHYGTTTGNVLKRLYDRDLDGNSLGYVSAVAVEETSIVNYNLGNPTSRVVAEGETLTPPNKRLVAVYPTEGSLESNNPLVVLGPDADWVTPEQREAAIAFQQFVVTPEAQGLLGDFGFRPVDPDAAPGGLITLENGVDPAQPTVRLPNPPTTVTAAAQTLWGNIRKPSSVLVLVDVSGSMSEPAGTGKTLMEEAKTSAKNTLGHFRPTDELGVWAFTTGISSPAGEHIAVIHPVEAGDRETLIGDIDNLEPFEGTPLYDAIATSYRYMTERAQPGRINAIIVLSDGEDTASQTTLLQLTGMLRNGTEAGEGAEARENPAPVRVFPIIYGDKAPPQALTEIAEASGGQLFSAKDPRRISLIFQQVVNNF